MTRQFIRGTVVVNLGAYADQDGRIGNLPADTVLDRCWITEGSGIGAIIDLGAAKDITVTVLDTVRWVVQHANAVEVRGENAEIVGAVTVALAFPGTGVPA